MNEVPSEVVVKMAAQEAAWNAGDIPAFMDIAYWNDDALLFVGSKGPTYGFEATLNNYLKSYASAEEMGQLHFELIEWKTLGPKHGFLLGSWALDRGRIGEPSRSLYPLRGNKSPRSAGSSLPIIAANVHSMSWMLTILVVTVIVSYQANNRPSLKEQLVYHPYRVKAFKEWHRIVAHAFVHADFTHLALNAFVLFQFGARLEGLMQQTLGAAFFPMLYFGGIALLRFRNGTAP